MIFALLLVGASLFVSGIDPGWVMDMLPVVASGASSDISEIRAKMKAAGQDASYRPVSKPWWERMWNDR